MTAASDVLVRAAHDQARSRGTFVGRAIIRVGAGGRISLDNAQLMFALKDIVEAVIDSVDPPFGEWYPLRPDPLAALPDAKEWMRNIGPRLVGEPTPNQESNPL